MIRTIALCVGLLAHVTIAAAQDVRLYVFTAEPTSGFVDADLKERRDALADLKKALAKTKGIILIDTAEEAHVRVEILGRGREATGGANVRRPLEFGPDVKPATEMTIRAKLRAGDYETELVAQTNSALMFQSGRWQDLAKDLGRKVERWIKDNRQQLLAPKPPQ